MSGYYPDPPVPTYWPDEPARYWADYHGTDYWADAPINDYPPEEPEIYRAEMPETSIWSAPVLAPASGPSLSPTPSTPAKPPQSSAKPNLSLVPKVAPAPAPPKRQTGNVLAFPSPAATPVAAASTLQIVDRRVLAIDAKQAIKMLLEANDDDGYTRADLDPDLRELEDLVKSARKHLKGGNLFNRIRNWMKPDES